MSPFSAFLAAPAPARSPDWVGVATRPGSGIGLLPAALSVQPLATAAALALTAMAASLVRRLSPRR